MGECAATGVPREAHDCPLTLFERNEKKSKYTTAFMTREQCTRGARFVNPKSSSKPVLHAASALAYRRRHIIAWLAALVTFATLTVVVVGVLLHSSPSSSDGPPSTDTDSSTLPDDRARLAFLKQYLHPASPVETTAFHIVYHNNGFAPSDYAMTILIKTTPAQVPLWRHDEMPLGGRDLSACHARAARDPRLQTHTAPEFVGTERCWRALFESEGVVCISCSTMK